MIQKKTIIVLGLGLLTMLAVVFADNNIRTYRQINDVATRENGKVQQSQKPADLFEFTYVVDTEKNTITRSKIRRLDESEAKDDATEYTITQTKEVIGSESGNGGKVFVAVRKDGNEILELGHRFAYTMRTSPFSQAITGVYKRVHAGERPK